MEWLREEGVLAVRGKLVENSLIVSKTADIAALPSFKRGLYHVMDEAAMLAVAAAIPASGARIMDICAAPGGKSFAAAYAAPAARILARDIHDFKVAQLIEGASRLGLNGISAEKWDATVFDEGLRASTDLLIADVPCSGLGTLRRRPDIKLFKREDSIDGLVALQRRILAASWEYVRPGGRLLYSTCTISSRENTENRDWFLANFPFRPVDFSAELPDFADYATAREGHVQILPQHYDTDGFFIAIFERE
jgi:16S rRNA (cytosine967-C5)-methyltransferase